MKTTYNLQSCNHIYVDRSVLQDELCSLFFQNVAHKNIALHLVLHDVTEVSQVDTLDSYGYVCDVIYGEVILNTVLQDVQKQGIKEKKVTILADMNIHTSDMLLICIGKDRSFESLELFLRYYHKKERSVRNTLATIGFLCMLYLVFYFSSFDNLPTWMVRGASSTLCVLLPLGGFLFVFLYGIRRKVFSIWEVLDWM